MDKLFDVLMPRLPPGAIIPAAVFLIVIFAWSQLRGVWEDLLPSYRAYSRQKRQLALLKLRYEIEALKKTNNLEELAVEPHPSKEVLPSEYRPSTPRLRVGWATFNFGALGGVLVTSLIFLFGSSLGADDFKILAPFLLISATLGGVAATLFSIRSKMLAFSTGVSAVTVLFGVIEMIMSGVAH